MQKASEEIRIFQNDKNVNQEVITVLNLYAKHNSEQYRAKVEKIEKNINPQLMEILIHISSQLTELANKQTKKNH